jgi:hypothetical protein
VDFTEVTAEEALQNILEQREEEDS